MLLAFEKEIDIGDLRKIISFIYDQFGYDFSNYSLSFFKRRVSKYIEQLNLDNIEDFYKYLELKPQKIEDFFKILSVDGTEFFRDPELWKCLRKLLTCEWKDKKEINIWLPQCSSGHELYSLCILLQEEDLISHCKIFASEYHSSLYEKTHECKCNEKECEEINKRNYEKSGGKHFLADYFDKIGKNYIIKKDLSENVEFGKFDLVNDQASNSNYDLVFFRNKAIYYNQYLQNQVFKKLHRSLKNKGLFIIGIKENINFTDVESFFTPVNKEEKIFRKIK